MRPAPLIAAFKRFKPESGIVGLALGRKEVAGETAGNPHAVTFFVKEKLAVKGARRRLSDGRRRLPKFVELEGGTIPTDVVTTGAEQSSEGSDRSPPQIYRAGGKISNMQLTGTIGCLVARRQQPGIYALTNQHIGLGAGTQIAFPDFNADQAFIGVTDASLGLVADERFLPPFDNPESYIDVDCALVRVPPRFENRFSPDIPKFGRPTGVFTPHGADASAYVQSLLDKPVFSYSWKSGPRSGTISHVYYVFERGPADMVHVACFLVQSNDDLPPGLLGDSGKLWMTQVNGSNQGVGVHFGVVADSPTSSRFALVTELASLARFLDFSLI
jgi:hypothetical protein